MLKANNPERLVACGPLAACATVLLIMLPTNCRADERGTLTRIPIRDLMLDSIVHDVSMLLRNLYYGNMPDKNGIDRICHQFEFLRIVPENLDLVIRAKTQTAKGGGVEIDDVYPMAFESAKNRLDFTGPPKSSSTVRYAIAPEMVACSIRNDVTPACVSFELAFLFEVQDDSGQKIAYKFSPSRAFDMTAKKTLNYRFSMFRLTVDGNRK